MGFGFSNIPSVTGVPPVKAQSLQGLHEGRRRVEQARQFDASHKFDREREEARKFEATRRFDWNDKKWQTEEGRRARAEIEKTLALLDAAMDKRDFGLAQAHKNRLKALGYDIDVDASYAQEGEAPPEGDPVPLEEEAAAPLAGLVNEEAIMQPPTPSILGPFAMPEQPPGPLPEGEVRRPSVTEQANQLQRQSIGGVTPQPPLPSVMMMDPAALFAQQAPAESLVGKPLSAGGLISTLSGKEAEEQTGETPQTPEQKAALPGAATAATGQGGQDFQAIVNAGDAMGLRDQDRTWTVRGPDGEVVGTYGAPNQRDFRRYIEQASGRLEGSQKEAWDAAGNIVAGKGLPFDKARENQEQLFKYFNTLSAHEMRSRIAALRPRGGGRGPAPENLFSKGEFDMGRSLKDNGELVTIETVLVGNQALDLLEEARRDPKRGGAILSKIAYLRSKMNDPGGRVTDKDLMVGIGFEGTMDELISKAQTLFGAGLSPAQIANMEAVLEAELEDATLRAQSNAKRAWTNLEGRPAGSYRDGGRMKLSNAYERLGYGHSWYLKQTRGSKEGAPTGGGGEELPDEFK